MKNISDYLATERKILLDSAKSWRARAALLAWFALRDLAARKIENFKHAKQLYNKE